MLYWIKLSCLLLSNTMASKVSRFFRKYFLEGQKLDEKQKQAIETLPDDAPLTTKILVKHRRLIGILIPLIFFEVLWWMQAFKHDYFSYFPDRYLLSITMIFGAACSYCRHDKWGRWSCCLPCHDACVGNRTNCGKRFFLDDPILWYDCCHIYYFVDENQVRRTLLDFLHYWRNWGNDFGSRSYWWFTGCTREEVRICLYLVQLCFCIVSLK